MSSEDLFEINQPRAFEHKELEDIPENPAEMSYKQLQEIVKRLQASTDFIREFDHNVKRKSKITKSIEEFLKSYKEEALEKSNGVKQTKMTTFFTIVEQNAEKTGPSDQKFSKPPLKELDEALELLSD